MTAEDKKMLKWIRLVAILEGISFLMIFFISMPLKYLAQILWPNQVIGMLHGVLFVLYVVLMFKARTIKNWTTSQFLWSLIASVIPLATFFVEKRMLQDED